MAARTKSRPGYATRVQAAEYIGVSPKTLANWKSLGRGPKWTKKGGGVIRYLWADLDAWMEGGDP